MISLFKGDCLVEMRNIPDKSVEAIIADIPYGTTACKWDAVIDFSLMWEQLNRIIKPNGAIVLFGSEPFSSALRMSNIKNYKYDWVWNKKNSGSGLLAKRQPLKITELIHVFSKNPHNYYPIMVKGKMRNKKSYGSREGSVTGEIKVGENNYNDLYYPKNIIEISNASQKGKQHPTQKPVELLEYLVKTYTREGEVVLDFTAGSGTTGVACVNLKRNFIGIEMDDKYFKIAKNRITEAESKLADKPKARGQINLWDNAETQPMENEQPLGLRIVSNNERSEVAVCKCKKPHIRFDSKNNVYCAKCKKYIAH